MKSMRWILYTVLAIAVIFGLIAGVMKLLKGEVYQRSVKVIHHDPRVKYMLGKKMEFSFFVTGNISQAGDNGVATYQYTIDGSKKDAEVFVNAERREGRWYLTQVVVTDKSSDERIYVVGHPEVFQ